MERLFALVWLLELVLAVGTGPSALAYWRRRRARTDWPRARLVALVLLVALASCVRRPAPATLYNREPALLELPRARVCDNGFVQPALWCGGAFLQFDGCHWRCEPTDP